MAATASAAPQTGTVLTAQPAVGKPSTGSKGKLKKKDFKATADGSTAASSYGLFANVKLLGATIGTQETPKSDWPAGPAQATTANVGVPGLLSSGTATTTATGDDLKDTANATAAVDGLGLGTSLGLQGVSADLISSQCTGTAAGVTATSTVTGLKLSGVLNSTPEQPAANTVVNVLGLGTLTLNEQTRTTVGGKTKLVVNALHLKLGGNGGLLDAVGTGDVIAGHTECSTTDALVPTVSSIAPTTGPTSGGTSVVITGTNFRGTSSVKFGSTEATYSIDSTTKITAVAPAGTGAQNVTVTTPGTTGGTNTGTNTFTYVGAPTVTNVNPSTGPPGGTTSVVITGTGFTGSPTVKFGNTNATSVTVNSPTQITATAPSGTGTVFVTVTTSGGTSAQSAASVYTYQDALSLTGISPATGPITGGTTVTATGTGFTTDSVIQFDANAQATTYVSPTKLTAVAPAGTGTAQVTVKRGSTTSTAQTFTYTALPPVVTGISPLTGSTAGGDVVTITGTGFTGATGVRFDTTNGTAFSVNGAGTQITVTSPAHAAGAAPVTVLSPNGDALAGSFFYATPVPAVPVPGLTAILTVAPDNGPLAGGTTVNLTGVFLTSGNTVTVGGKPATVTGTPTLTTLSFVTPAGDAPGTVPVVVTNASGTSLVNVNSTFTYNAATPTIGTIAPTNGPASGGTEVTLTGTNYTSSSVVYWGTGGTAIPLTTTYVNGTTLRFTTPPGLPGNQAFTVRTGGVTSTASNFTYNAVAAVTGISPLTGPVTGGTEVTITGTGLDTVTSIQVGTKTTTPKAGGSATQIKFDTPANTAGAYLVTLSGTGGAALTPGTFIYTPTAAGAATVSPTTGPIQGGNTVTITGTGFSSILALTVGAKVVTNYTVTGDTTLTFPMPSGLTDGVVPVIIATAGGIVTLNYEYVAFDGQITGISPISGPTSGGTVVTITGTGFTGATGVRFDSTPGTAFSVNGAGTQITVTSPSHATGLATLTIVGPGGIQSTSTALFTYLPLNLSPTVTTLVPSVGPIAGGTDVTIYGTGLLLTSGVTFGGTPATNIRVINTTTVIVTSPAHAAGAVDVILTTPVGSSTAGDATFTYVAANSVPVLDTMTPRSGPTVGGTTVVFKGIGLQTVDRVTFDGTAGTDLSVVDDTTLTVKTPPHAAGGIAVLLRNTQGNSRSYLFTYVPLSGLPTVQGLTPNVGPVAGGTRVTITGTGFDAATTVSFDGVEGTDLQLWPDVDDPKVGSASAVRKSTKDRDFKARSAKAAKAVLYKPAMAGKAVGNWKAAASNSVEVTTPPHAGGPTTVTVTNSAGSISFLESFTFIPVLAATATIETEVEVGATKAIAPKGPDYSGLEVTACSTPDGTGSVEISSSAKSCVYTAGDTEGEDTFVMSVTDDIGQESEQTVNVTVVEEGGTGTGDDGGNDSGDGDGTGTGDGSGNNSGDGDGSGTDGSGGNDTGGGLAFTGTPLLLIPGLALGLLLMVVGGGLLGAERLRTRRGARAATDEEGRQLMPAGLLGTGLDPHEGQHREQPDHPDDVA